MEDFLIGSGVILLLISFVISLSDKSITLNTCDCEGCSDEYQ